MSGSHCHTLRLTPATGLEAEATLQPKASNQFPERNSRFPLAITSPFRLFDDPLIKACCAPTLSIKWIHGLLARSCGHSNNAIKGPMASISNMSVVAPVFDLDFCKDHNSRNSGGISRYTGFGCDPSGDSPNFTTPTPESPPSPSLKKSLDHIDARNQKGPVAVPSWPAHDTTTKMTTTAVCSSDHHHHVHIVAF